MWDSTKCLLSEGHLVACSFLPLQEGSNVSAHGLLAYQPYAVVEAIEVDAQTGRVLNVGPTELGVATIRRAGSVKLLKVGGGLKLRVKLLKVVGGGLKLHTNVL